MNKTITIILITFCAGCIKNNTGKFPNYLNQDIRFNLSDSIILSGSAELVFSNFLYPLENNLTEFIAFDLLTSNLLFYNKNNPKYSNIKDLKNKFQMYPSLSKNMLGVVKMNDSYLLCSDPYFLLIDSNLNIQKVFKLDFVINSIKYQLIGDITNIRINQSNKSIYIPVSPGLPQKSKDSFSLGRIIEINLEKGDIKILPLKLPTDYEKEKDYKLFSLPNFTVFHNKLFCIYPGSNYLYEYDLKLNTIDSIYIKPKHASINIKEVGNSIDDMLYTYFECNIFYQIISDDNLLLLFYWKGKQRGTYNRQKGLKEIDCYIIGYDPVRNEVLFDSPLYLTNVLKKAYKFKDNIIYFVADNYEEKMLNKLESRILKYEIEVY